MLRYWEQEFTQLRPVKRRGNRRYYQLHEVKLIRHIRQLLYEQGFTIVGARNQLQEFLPSASVEGFNSDPKFFQLKPQAQQNGHSSSSVCGTLEDGAITQNMKIDKAVASAKAVAPPFLTLVRHELMNIRDLLGPMG